MRRATASLGLLLLLALGCGKYGPPERAGASASASRGHDAARCNDPAHDHEAAAEEEEPPDAGEPIP